MTELHLFSAQACPYAHRTRLVLGYKQLEFKLTEIDLRNKPAWFGSVSLYGKVPALEHAGTRLIESAVINEYLDEAFPEPKLLPKDPASKALARIWIDFANTRLAPAFHALLRGATESEREQGSRDLLAALQLIEREGLVKLSAAGPYFLGRDPSLVDFTFYPWFERLPAVQHYRTFTIPADLLRLQRWLQAVSALPAVTAIANSKAFYVQRYASVPTSAPKPSAAASSTQPLS